MQLEFLLEAANRQSFSTYEPGEISIPSGMTVVWFNDDVEIHTATTVSNRLSEGSSSPMQFDTGAIPSGGFSVFTFTKPGVYDYYCKLHPYQHGRINVGDQLQTGTNMDMRIGGKIPFDSTKLARMTFSFVPKNISLPPLHSITYNVTLFNLTSPLYKHQFVDTDGILDLEIIPIKRTIHATIPTVHTGNDTITIANSTSGVSSHRNLTTMTTTTVDAPYTNSLPMPSIPLSSSTIQTTTYGPDINDPITGTFHVQGPILIEPHSYRIKVQIVDIDDKTPPKPVIDEFELYEKIGFLIGL